MDLGECPRAIPYLAQHSDEKDMIDGARLQGKRGGAGLDKVGLALGLKKSAPGLNEHLALDIEADELSALSNPVAASRE